MPGIAVQLYSVRVEIAADLDGTLAQLRDAGYEGVELANYDTTARLDHLAEALDRHGLQPVAAHIPLPSKRIWKDWALRQAETFGISTFVFPGNRDEPRALSTRGRSEIIAEYAAAVEWAADQHLSLGFHHHWWELSHDAEGGLLLSQLAKQLPSATFFELDPYWARLKGIDVNDIFDATLGRAPLIHLKDGPADDPDSPMCTLGEGAADVADVLTNAAESEWWIAELMTSSTDMLNDLRESARYLHAARRIRPLTNETLATR